MKLIIAGSRGFADDAADRLVAAAVEASGWFVRITQVISGGARGIDQAGERWAAVNGLPVQRFPADWSQHGKAAGMIRNRAMAEVAGAALVIWDGQSRGAANMAAEAKKRGLPVFVFRPES